MPPILAEDTLTSAEVRVFFTFDDAVTITGDVDAIPVGWIELDENSDYQARGRGNTGDAQTRATRGHEKPVVNSRSDEITFSLRPKADVDPVMDRGIDIGTIMRLLRVNSDGTYRSDLVIVTDVQERSPLTDLPEWNGTAGGRAHPVRGRITTWPPVATPGP